jgi:predicted transcriptional regulator
MDWDDPRQSLRGAREVVPWRKAVAAVIAATRRDHDVTQHELARRVGWSRDKLAKAEAGLRRLEFGDVVMISQALGEKSERVIRRILAWNG